ncbi:MAG: S-layer homology domain-containing protein [Candidatus Riflebacteria bacterium]|jgi:hypothetical protein|nr:S-layer homology domain-containing protein [Candidatus Riflebacteria bacterium]
MLIGKKEFITGLILATITWSVNTDIAPLQAAGQKRLSAEIAFSQQIGLFDATQLNKRMLDSNITEHGFIRGLSGVLVESGLISSFDQRELINSGIIKAGTRGKSISREAACETLLRAVMHGWHNELLPHPAMETSLGFRDWHPEDKYKESLTFAITSGLVQGSSQGFFMPDSKLKVKEALILLKRFFDLATTSKLPTRIGLFEDVMQDHYMTGPLVNLRKAGAFDLTNLGRRLNGTGSISGEDLSKIVQGILGRLDKPAAIARVKQLEQHYRHKDSSRNLLACMGAILTQSMPHSETNNHILYSDVKENSVVDRSLKILAKAGIRMGYNNNLFKGNERVSRFEALGLINRIITELEPAQIKISHGKTATREDAESLKNLLIERKARIRRILSRES